MSWKFVLNGAKFLAGTHINDVKRAAIECHYSFFTHNGYVYFITDEGIYHRTDITVEDLF